jgi:hypothetical protein
VTPEEVNVIAKALEPAFRAAAWGGFRLGVLAGTALAGAFTAGVLWAIR